MKIQKSLFRLATVLTLVAFTTLIQAEDAKPVGTVEIDETQVMAIIGGTMGGGTLTFDGATHKFKAGGMSLGASVGVQDIKLHGNVYHMTDIKDFPGVYFVAEAGVTVVAGGSGLWLENDKGVTMHLVSNNEGLAIDIQAEGLKITMK
jgi:hypothetical protein